MKSMLLLLLIALVVSSNVVQANWFGKRDDKDDGFQQFLSEKLSHHTSSKLADRAALAAIAQIIQNWLNHSQDRTEVFKKMT